MHTVIVANAPTFDAHPFRDLIQTADLLIAADGGGDALAAIAVVPHLVIGDLDSLSPSARTAFSAAGVDVQQFPTDKDETDLELALLAAVTRGATRIDVLGALGGRWDQSLANVALLALPELHGCHVRLLDPTQEAFLVRTAAPIHGAVGDTVSLLPLTGAAHGITTQGLHYALHEASLPFARSRGVSNRITTSPAYVTLREGLLLVVHLYSDEP